MAPGNTLSTDDDLKLFYAIIKLSSSKPRMAEVAAFMGLKEGATNWRYNALMKRCKAKFGEDGSGGTAEDAAAATSPAPSPSKRKRANNNNKSKSKGEPAVKKGKVDAANGVEEDDVKVKDEVKDEDGVGPVKTEDTGTTNGHDGEGSEGDDDV